MGSGDRCGSLLCLDQEGFIFRDQQRVGSILHSQGESTICSSKPRITRHRRQQGDGEFIESLILRMSELEGTVWMFPLTAFCFKQKGTAQERGMACPRSHEFEAEPGLALTSDFPPRFHVLGSGLWTPTRKLSNWPRTDLPKMD